MRIRARGIEFEGRHGATRAERRSSRRFRVDLDIEVADGRAAETDRLEDTIDYHELCHLVVEIGTSGTCRLLETLASRMAAAIGERHPSAAVTLEVRKLHPPCPGHPRYTAVRVSRPPSRREP
jgi:dihydroneopterin aldolase